MRSAQIALLIATEDGGKHINGSQVRSARALESIGLVSLTDDGALGRSVRERWFVKITDAGRSELKALRRMKPEAVTVAENKST